VDDPVWRFRRKIFLFLVGNGNKLARSPGRCVVAILTEMSWHPRINTISYRTLLGDVEWVILAQDRV